MTKKEIVSILILVCVIGYGLYRFITREYTETKSQYILDTIVLVSASSSQKNVGKQIDSVFTYIKKLEAKFNEYDSNSMIWQINNSDNEKHPMDADLFAMLVIADSLYQLSGAAFDITIKPVFDLWHFEADSLSVPDSLLIKETLNYVGFDKLTYDQDYLYMPKGMQITLGAIAKGYILDRAHEYMNSLALNKGFINCRSSITYFGSKLPQLVYIQHPRKLDDYIASFKLKNLSIATSGDYQQFFEQDGQRYHHILSPFTGYPVKNVYSVTVIHPSAAWADGLSTALFVMPPNSAAEVVNAIDFCDAIIYFDQEDTIVSLKTNGMKNYDLAEKL